jgi:hypothetical protein
MAKNPHLSMENRISVCREYADLWQTFFQYLMEDFPRIEITEDMEKQFENVITILALNHYKFAELCGEYMKDTDGIVKSLADVVSLQHLKDMQESTRGKITVETHTLLIDMHKAVGKMVSKLTPKQLQAMQARTPQEQA